MHSVFDEVDFAVGDTNIRRLAAKATIEPTRAGEGWYHDAAIEAATAAAIEARSNPYRH